MGHEYPEYTYYFCLIAVLAFLQHQLSVSASALEQDHFRHSVGCRAGERLHGGGGGGGRADSSESRRIVAIGDVHGSLIGLHELLYTSGISSSRNSCNWHPDTSKQGGVVLVQTGDIVDRGPNASEAWHCLKNLFKAVPRIIILEVIRLIGNHELWWRATQLP